MAYTLYIGENCHQCDDVVSFLENEKIEFRKVNVDLSNEKPPIKLFAFPALFKDGILIKYGSDIMNYFKKSPI